MSHVGDGRPALAFQVVLEEKIAGNRMHVDLTVEDRRGFVEYVESVGGLVVVDHNQGLRMDRHGDPEGNEFCITQHRPVTDRFRPPG